MVILKIIYCLGILIKIANAFKCDYLAGQSYANGTIKLALIENEVKTLHISGTNGTEISNETLSDFPHLERLFISNSDLQKIDKHTFSTKLTKLKISNTQITTFDPRTFYENNTLVELILSRNEINTLASFDVRYFPNLEYLDVSHNNLEYLPVNILQKLKEINNFTLKIYDNPWNCSHSFWLKAMTKELSGFFCSDENRNQYGNDNKNDGTISPSVTEKQCNANKNNCSLQIILSIIGGVLGGTLLGIFIIKVIFPGKSSCNCGRRAPELQHLSSQHQNLNSNNSIATDAI